MTTNSTIIPVAITRNQLLERAGSNVTPNNVSFEHRTFDGTPAFEHRPVESIDAYAQAVREDYEITERTEEFPGYTTDEVAVGLAEVMNRFGEGLSKITKRGPMDRPSTRTVVTGFDIVTGKKSTATVPDGAATLPGFHGDNPYIQVGTRPNGQPFLHAQVLRREQGLLEGLFAYVRDWVAANSIYVNQAINTSFQFLDFHDFNMRSVAQTAKVSAALRLHVLNPMRCGEVNRMLGVEPKTGLLFEGPPGGGKTMVVTLAIKMFLMEQIGTVIVVDPADGITGFKKANAIANRLMEAGHMAMIVMEDMEKLAGEDRAAILDMLDGSDAKDARRIVIGTTNFLENMDPAMIREGRFNDVVHCGLPDRQAFEHLLRIMLVRKDPATGEELSLLADDVDFDEAWIGQPIDTDGNPIEDAEPIPYFEGFSFAFISGAVQNILRYAALELGPEDDWRDIRVSTRALQQAALLKREHFELMGLVKAPEGPPSLDAAFKQAVREAGGVEGIDWSRMEEAIATATDGVVEHRLHRSSILLETESGKEIKGRLSTN